MEYTRVGTLIVATIKVPTLVLIPLASRVRVELEVPT